MQKEETVKIPLSQGKFALIDRGDYFRVSQHRWYYSHPYARTSFKSRKINLHRFINNTPNGLHTDHINRNTLDNRKCNLRSVSHKVNIRNHKILKTNTSGYNGISWNKAMRKWESYIWVDNIKKRIGYFEDIISAVKNRKLAELKYWND